MTREELHVKAQKLSTRLLSLPTFCREAIFPEGKIEVQRFFENLLAEFEQQFYTRDGANQTQKDFEVIRLGRKIVSLENQIMKLKGKKAK